MTELFHLFASRPIVDRTVEPVREFEPLYARSFTPAEARLRRCFFTAVAAILLPLAVATAWAVVTTEGFRLW